jgi:hypothetical protein
VLAEPETSKAERAALETTDDMQDIFDAIDQIDTVRQKYINEKSHLGVKSFGETHSRRTVLAKYSLRQYESADIRLDSPVTEEWSDGSA